MQDRIPVFQKVKSLVHLDDISVVRHQRGAVGKMKGVGEGYQRVRVSL